MQIHLSPRHIRLTSAIHAYVAQKISHLEGHADQQEIMAAHVVLMHDENAKKPYTVKVHLAMPGPDIHGEDTEQDLYAAIDKVYDKLYAQLRKRKTRRLEHKKHLVRKAVESVKRGDARR